MKIIEELVPDEVKAKLPDSYTNPFMEFKGGDEESMPAFNGLTGDLLFRLPHPGGRRVSRQALRRVLTTGLDIQWGRKLTGLASTDAGVTLAFADGSTFEADFVVGADGAQSTLRQLLLGEEAAKPTLTGLTWATAIVNYNDAEKAKTVLSLHPVAAIVFCPDSVVGLSTLR